MYLDNRQNDKLEQLINKKFDDLIYNMRTIKSEILDINEEIHQLRVSLVVVNKPKPKQLNLQFKSIKEFKNFNENLVMNEEIREEMVICTKVHLSILTFFFCCTYLYY